MKLFVVILLFLFANASGCKVRAQDYMKAAIEFFESVKNNHLEKASAEIRALAAAQEDVLKSQLQTSSRAKAFWLNIYNTFVQYQLKRNPTLFDDRDAFFKTRSITIANTRLSLDDIEHGIIRHSKNKYSFGYLASFFVSDFESTFRLKEMDYRIHFALNCGARSCPPVAVYLPDKVDQQLEKATQLYLGTASKFDPAKNIVHAPAFCLWFSADFGGETGVVEMMKKYAIVPASAEPAVKYLPYDWSLKLSSYITL
jgi:hypothetical protein